MIQTAVAPRSSTLVVLEWWEFELAAAVGVRRQGEALRDRRPNQRQTNADDLHVHILGACGELAAANTCGVNWHGSVNARRGRGDIGPGWEVRTAYKTPPGRLVLKPGDRDDAVFIFVFADLPWRLHVHGWITAREGRRLGVVEGYNGHDPAVFVRPENLRPIVDLIAF